MDMARPGRKASPEKPAAKTRRAPPERDRVLVLQGGGALGSYQAGIYEVLDEADLCPHWVAGISIGAINAALIAGNAPGRRVERLREFWTIASSTLLPSPLVPPEGLRSIFNDASAAAVIAYGVPGFFMPRFPPPFFQPPGSLEALSFYDTAPLRETLERLVDFDRINARETRLSVGAVNIRTGNFINFDNYHHRIGPEHIMASGALPPGFPPIEIDGEFYWDGGLVSNTPLQYVIDEEKARDLVILQVDLFPARGPMPRNLSEASTREKDIRYSSRTRLNTDDSLRMHAAKVALRKLIDTLPEGLVSKEEMELLRCASQESSVTVVQLIYRHQAYEGHSKDYEFSRTTMQEHWKSGMEDMRRTLEHREWLIQNYPESGVATFDFSRKIHPQT
jgi:NTE family protein